MKSDFAVIVPLANESSDFHPFVSSLTEVLDGLGTGTIYFIVDKVSRDNTLELCMTLSRSDVRFITVWAPENKNVVDAYLRGYREALNNGHQIIIEMDAGLSHDPKALPMFLRVLNEGNECAFGSRFINGGSICDSTWKRSFLSKFGTILSNVLLGTKLYDMTSGYQGFHAHIVNRFVDYKLLSKAHFYQTELRYLLRKSRYAEIPIHYRAPSPSVSQKAIKNSFQVLLHYFFLRLRFKTPVV
ncbi:dolichol-phosphate mannosyltransferase [Salinimicrobium sediminis]|uniref:Dolichol-phosphate mannosyltransferase n=1 Tax=Salinimicrobium sediminis TaxID=1343891 RepID=A0A285X0M2_9FLAO|nr:glycosyltransferase [Salinimicrobium sediminis]SOC78546.1 dolichol-phosphate mannosyltransferase [Salinimicrobium sediminis]